MAGSSIIGALRIVLGAETALFESGLKSAQRDLDAFHRRVTQVGSAIGASIGAAAVGLGVALQGAINRADEMGKMAQRIGIPVEQLSGLRLAADLSGVSMESLGTAVGRLSRGMSEMAGGATNSLSKGLQALGISVTNSSGTLKPWLMIVEEVADRFATFRDSASKTALAIAIFGRQGAGLIPMLNQGAAGLRAAREEAEQLGLVIDQKTSLAAESFNDNMRRLRLVVEGVALRVTAELAPSLSLLSAMFVQSAKDGDLVNVSARAIASALEFVVHQALLGVVAFQRFKAEVASLGEAALALTNDLLSLPVRGFNAVTGGANQAAGAFDRTRAAWDTMGQTISVSTKAFEDIAKQFAHFRHQAELLAEWNRIAASAAARVEAPILATESALDKFIKTQQKAIAGERAEAATIGQVAGSRESLRIIMQGQAIAQENNIALTARSREQLAALAGEARNAALQQAGFQLVLENKTPLEQYQLALTNTQIAMRAVGATAEEIARAQEKAAERFGMSWSAVGTNIAGTAGALSQLTGTFAKENKAMGIASKAFGIAQAVINTQVAITKALATLPPPASYAAVALAVAQGAASIAAISAQKFASGGAMRTRLPPGSGVDSQLLTARVRPDEQVDIWRPGEGPEQRRGGRGGFTVVQMQLPSGAAGRFIEELISDLNGKIADGYRLKVA